jgi:hypothetical protein
VYWDDRDETNLDQYTFYREGTPPPSDYEIHEKTLGHGDLNAPVAESSAASGGVGGSERNWSLTDSNDLGPTTKNRAFWIKVAVAVLIVIGIAVGLGAGLGVGLSRPSAQPAQQPSRSVPA